MLAKILKNPLLRQSLWSIIARFVGVGLNFAVAILIAQKLPKAEAGMFFLLITYVTGFALFSRIGIDQLLMKEVASAHEDNQEFRNGFLHSSYKFVFLLSIVFIALWLALSPFIRDFSFDGKVDLNYLMFAGIGILFFNFIILNSTYLKAIQKTVIAVLSQNALPATTLLIVLGLFWNSFGTDQLYINLYTTSLVFAGVIAIVLTWSHLSIKDRKSSYSPRFSELFKKSLPLAPVAIFSFLMIFADTIMVSFFLPNEDVALYSIAGRISFIVLFFLGALEATIYPRLLNVYNHKPAQLHSFFWQSTALVIGVVLSVTAVMYFLSDWILYVFGEGYADAKQALGLLLIAQFLRAASITFSFMFIIREKVRYLNIILVLALIINLICNVIFIKKYGIEGAALATLISNGVLLFSVLTLFMTNKLLKIPAKSEAKGEQIA
ncbi:MAG: flippase [Cocleimonas sp.]|nr:flippase [Cocleimonas sp.]